jgi:hypothetical protein
VPALTLANCCTLAEIAPKVGSYFTAYSLAAAGAFGDPVGVVGRSKLFSAGAVERALAERATNRKRPAKTA